MNYLTLLGNIQRMMNRFFSSKNRIEKLSEIDFCQLSDYYKVLHAFARTAYTSVYVIDYEKQAFEYVSENPLFLCGNSAEEVKEMGYAFYFKYVAEEDLDLLARINSIGFEYFEGIPVKERTQHTTSYDFHLKTDKGKKILVHHKLTPVFLTESGKLWKAICVVSLSTEKGSGNIKITKQGTNNTFLFDLIDNRWKTVEKINLSDREWEILRLSIRGFTISEIAEETFVSSETIKFHRKKLFRKLNVTNISEAIFYAANNKLL